VLDFAIEQGWLSDKVAIPRLNRKGKKGSARPGFSREELVKLMAFLPEWSRGGERKNHKEMRLLLRDYVEVLLGTGCRSGRESMAMQWRHLEWHAHANALGFLAFPDRQALSCIDPIHPLVVDIGVLRTQNVMDHAVASASALMRGLHYVLAQLHVERTGLEHMAVGVTA
jgi:hypothetical protein